MMRRDYGRRTFIIIDVVVVVVTVNNHTLRGGRRNEKDEQQQQQRRQRQRSLLATGWLGWAIKIPAANCSRMCVSTVKTCTSVDVIVCVCVSVCDAGHRRTDQSQGAAAASGLDDCVTVCVSA